MLYEIAIKLAIIYGAKYLIRNKISFKLMFVAEIKTWRMTE